jgi:tripartite-type tricarboxylate transporter receptor subunit TctC
MKRMLVVLAALCALAPFAPAHAQPYPTKPIRMIAPYPPGGATDILARLISQGLTESLGVPVVVENKAGANGQIGHEFVAKAPPDGYTLLLGNSAALAVSISMYDKLTYDPIKDYAPITLAAQGALVMIVNPNVPASNLQEFLAWARSRDGKVSAGLAGVGAMHHLVTEQMRLQSGVSWINVPYKGSAPMVMDVLSGQVDFGIDNIPSSLPHIKAGKLRALAVTSAKRTPLLPDVPTLAEAGMPGIEAAAWHGVLAPAGTPPAIVAKLNAEIVKILRSPEMTKRLADLGLDPIGSSPQQFADFIASENVKWARIVKASGAKLE